MADENDIICSICQKHMREVYGYCVVCPNNTLLCQWCIAKGVEFGCHRNNHQIITMRLDMSLLEVGWTAAEELDLLDALLLFGPCDWDNVAKYMDSGHTAKEIREHYLRVYQNDHHTRIKPAFISHQVNSHDPPRFTSASVLHSAFSGYNAARGEFQTDYDNEAEQRLSSLDPNLISATVEGWSDEERDLESDLFFAVVNNYNMRLQERKRRHQVIREHGLIQPQKNFLWLRRFDDANMHWGARGGDRQHSSAPGVTTQLAKTLTKCAQFLSGIELDKVFEGLKLESDLKSSLEELYELRRNGVTNFYMATLYKRYSQRQEEFSKERRKCSLDPYLRLTIPCNGRVGKFPHLVTQPRRSAPPLNISRMPGCDKLTVKERELCSVARIVPESFMEFKNILVAACLKQGGLRLIQARSLIKIDVNKTRKLYDFLLEEGAIYQS